MTAYATTAQITTAAGGAAGLVQLFDWDRDGTADADQLAQVQSEVDRWIDSFAGTRYAVPLESPNAAITMCSAEEVVFRARVKRNLASDVDRENHEARVKWLESIARGRVVPSDPQPPKAASNRSAWVDRDTDDVSREGLKGLGW